MEDGKAGPRPTREARAADVRPGDVLVMPDGGRWRVDRLAVHGNGRIAFAITRDRIRTTVQRAPDDLVAVEGEAAPSAAAAGA